MWLLAADIGGTNTRILAVKSLSGGVDKRLEGHYASQDYADLQSILQHFISEHAIDHIDAACLAVAGPVKDGTARITNLPWVIEEDTLTHALPIDRVRLINDFSGVAHGISELQEHHTQTLQAAKAQPDGTQVVLGAGTGLGMAIIMQQGTQYHVLETEAGHVSFAPRDDEELAMLSYWQEQLDHVSNETFLSGRGIQRIFEFYVKKMGMSASEQLTVRLQQEADPAGVINQFAQTYKEPVAVKTMQRFADIYASVASDMALATKATGGVYLAGGIAPLSLPILQTDRFIRLFNNKPPMTALLATIPVKVIINTTVGLLGAMVVAERLRR